MRPRAIQRGGVTAAGHISLLHPARVSDGVGDMGRSTRHLFVTCFFWSIHVIIRYWLFVPACRTYDMPLYPCRSRRATLVGNGKGINTTTNDAWALAVRPEHLSAS